MSYRIYLVRHGTAGPPPAGMGDGDRTLTPEGRRRVRRAAAGLQRLGVSPQAVLTSPLPRAHQTAELLVEVLAPDLPVEIWPRLAPGHEAAQTLKGLRLRRGVREVILVGHEPDLGRLGSYFLTGSAGMAPLPLKKCGVAAFACERFPPRSASPLLWLLQPKQLRAIGKGA